MKREHERDNRVNEMLERKKWENYEAFNVNNHK
jgi:hypothetical protein